MTEAVGIHDHPTQKLGRRPEDTSRRKVAFADFLTAPPEHPLVDSIPALGYPMDHNDTVGDCVVAGTDHALQIIHTLLNGSYNNWTDDQLLHAYQTQNPDFTSWADAGSAADRGMIVAQFLDWCIASGHILAYAKIDTSSYEMVRAAVYIGLAVVTGENLQQAQQQGKVWDYVPGSPDWGGHCTVWGGYEATDQVVSWGDGGYTMTDAFISNRVEEAYFVLTQAHLDHPEFRNHFDVAGFAKAVSDITNGKVVVPVPPPGSHAPGSDADPAGAHTHATAAANPDAGPACAPGAASAGPPDAADTRTAHSGAAVAARPNAPGRHSDAHLQHRGRGDSRRVGQRSPRGPRDSPCGRCMATEPRLMRPTQRIADESSIGVWLWIVLIVAVNLLWVSMDLWLHLRHHELLTVEFREGLRSAFYGPLLAFLTAGSIAAFLWHMWNTRDGGQQ